MKYGFLMLAVLASATAALAAPVYFQGFETDTSGWVQDPGGNGTGSITQTPSGTNGINAADGSYYATVTNNTDAYQPGYGTGGYSLFGGNNTSDNPFFQSMDIYIDPFTAAAASPATAAFWIDASASSSNSDPNNLYGSEQSFNLFYDGNGTVTVDATGGPAIATITTAGWYDFQFLYSQSDANPTDASNTTLSVSAVGGSLLGATTLANTSDGEVLANQDLAGPGYIWLPVWQNGFSNDTLYIDDVQADVATPEPSSVVLLLAGMAGLGLLARRRLA